jgi:hypothetical protein
MSAAPKIQALLGNIERVIKGKPSVIEMVVVALGWGKPRAPTASPGRCASRRRACGFCS